MFPGSRKKIRVSDKCKFDKVSHCVGKVKQQRHTQCRITTLYSTNRIFSRTP